MFLQNQNKNKGEMPHVWIKTEIIRGRKVFERYSE